jgi:arylsulfatase
MSGCPTLVRGKRQLLFGGMKRLSLYAGLNILNKSWAATAEVVVPEAGAQGVIFASGGLGGGLSLYAGEDGAGP